MKYIPNILSFTRLLLTPLFVFVFFKNSPQAAFAVFVCASVLDVFDGFLARKLNAITDLGKIIDPLADKVLQISAFICFTINKKLPVFIAFVLGIKEIIMLVGGAIVSQRDKIIVFSNKFGKIASFCISISLCMMFFVDGFLSFASDAVYALMYASVGMSIIAMFQYAYFALIANKCSEKEKKNEV